MMNQAPWYDRFGWILFVVIGSLGLVMVSQFMFFQSALPSIIGGTGHPIPSSITSDPEASAFFSFFAAWAGTALLGANLLTVFIAATAFRRGAAWAWLAMWYWPVNFASHLLMYDEGMLRGVQIFWLVVTVTTLALTYKRAFAPTGDLLVAERA